MKTDDEELEKAIANRMLNCLGLAIDEARGSRRRIQTREVSGRVRPESYYVDKVRFLDREIECLQALQRKLRSRIDAD